MRGGNWRKLIVLNPENSAMSFEQSVPKLQGKKNLLFIFTCFNNGQICKFGAFLSDTLAAGVPQQDKKSVFDQYNGKNMRGMANDSSFFFYYSDFAKLHALSTSRKSL
jgi:hypothetical protein